MLTRNPWPYPWCLCSTGLGINPTCSHQQTKFVANKHAEMPGSWCVHDLVSGITRNCCFPFSWCLLFHFPGRWTINHGLGREEGKEGAAGHFQPKWKASGQQSGTESFYRKISNDPHCNRNRSWLDICQGFGMCGLGLVGVFCFYTN